MPAPLVTDFQLPLADTAWIDRLPDGAVSIETSGEHWVLRASHQLQSQFEELLERQKAGTLNGEEQQQFEAIRALDDLLSGFNRLARRIQQG